MAVNEGWLARARAFLQRVLGSSALMGDARIATGIRQLSSVLQQQTQAPPSDSMPSAAGAISPDQLSPDDGVMLSKLAYLWRLSGSDPAAYMNYVRQVPDPTISSLVQNPGLFRTLTDRMVRSVGIERPQSPGDGLEPTKYQSSNVAGYTYDPKRQRVFVKFHNGGIYGYEGVPQWVWQAFRDGAATAKTTGSNQWGSWFIGKNPSIGAAVWQYLREMQFPYQKLS